MIACNTHPYLLPARPVPSEQHLLVAKEAWSRRLTSWHRICAGMTLESDRLVVVGGSLLARGKWSLTKRV